MNPTPKRTSWINDRALELAGQNKLTAVALARRAIFSDAAARRVIRGLVAAGKIVDIGPAGEKTGGRWRRCYGLGPGVRAKRDQVDR
jgi:predicted HTH transcriptional regulator